MVHLFFWLWIILIKMGLPAWAGHSIQLFPWTHAMAESVDWRVHREGAVVILPTPGHPRCPVPSWDLWAKVKIRCGG